MTCQKNKGKSDTIKKPTVQDSEDLHRRQQGQLLNQLLSQKNEEEFKI